MRYIFALVFMFIFTAKSTSQTYEIGPSIGAANYIGDVGNTAFVAPSTLGFGAIFKWNRSTRHAFRFSLLYINIEADDAEASETRRNLRGYSFENSVFESSLGIEYTFWEYDLHSGEPQFTPYLYTGLTYIKTNHFEVENDALQEAGANWDFAIPMVVGAKANITRNLIGAVEVGARYTFTDNIDGSNPEEMDNPGGAVFGNANTNDWYVYTGLTITFAFGRKPCFCSF